MSDILSRLEFLPNEILIDIFQYLQAQDLFAAFYNLNLRFNTLLLSFDNLSLTIKKLGNNNTDDFDLYSSFIYKLTIKRRIDIDLSCFTNIRHLHLLCATSDHIKQLESDILPNLEYLSIGYQHFRYSHDMSDLCTKIFYNGFPKLKSCYLFEPKIIKIIPSFIQSPELHTLKIESISLLIYQMILSNCPNLHLFKFTIVELYVRTLPIDSHRNLKRMIIKIEELVDPLNDSDIRPYLSCIPNLEQLSIHQTNLEIDITDYLTYDWFLPTIDSYLLLLRRFKFTIHLSQVSELMKGNTKDILNRMKEKFHDVHNNRRYESELVCDLSKLRFWD